MSATVPVRLYLPSGGDITNITATEDGNEYVPGEICTSCYAIVPQMYADEHTATHPAPPPEVQPV